MGKVIIDGVDVSKCEFCEFDNILGYQCYEYIAEDGASPADNCNNRENCYYKQLKHKEQECEEWEKLANEANERANDYANDIGKLQEDVRYYKELSKDFDTKLKLAHQDFTDFIQKQKLEISELKAELNKKDDLINDITNGAVELQKENEQLKAENKKLKTQYNCYACDNCSGKEDYRNMRRHCENAITSLHNVRAENERLKFKLNTVEADYEASEIEIEDLKNKLNLLTTANNHLLELDKYRQKELETKAEATKSNIHNLALLSKANKTLQDIREIAEKELKDVSDKCKETTPMFSTYKNILAKINEVIGAEE